MSEALDLLNNITNGNVAEEDIIREVQKLLAKQDWQTKVVTTGIQMSKLVRQVAATRSLIGMSRDTESAFDDTLGMMYLTIVHACYMHPEWMVALVRESEEFVSDMQDSKPIDELMQMWPIQPQFSEEN